jgi:hypothetical protein
VNVPGNGLDAFEPEISAPPPTQVASSSLLEIVSAYPEPEICPPAWRTSPKEPFRPRHFLAATLGAARAVVLFPFVVLSWFVVRIWWLIRLGLSGVWRAITGTMQLIADAFFAIGRGIRAVAYAIGRGIGNVTLVTVRLLIGAVTAIAFAVRTVTYGIGRALARGAAVLRSAAIASVRGTLDGIALTGTLIARSAVAVGALARATVRAIWNTVVIAPTRLLVRAVTASTRAGRDGIYSLGRALARGAAVLRSAAIASVRGTLDGIAFAGTLIARSAVAVAVLPRASVRAIWSTVVIAPTRLLIRAVTASARAGRDGIYGFGRALARGAAVLRSAAIASVRGTLDGIAFAGTLIARSAVAVAVLARASVRAIWSTVVIAPTRLLIRAVTASARSGRDGIYGFGRALARGAAVLRSAAIASVRGTLDGIAVAGTLVARSTAAGAHGLHRGSGAAGRGAAVALDVSRAEFASFAHRVREAKDRVTTRLGHDGPPVLRMAVAGIPSWARQARLAPVIAAGFTVVAGISLGLTMLLLSQRDVQRVAAPAASAPLPVAATVPVVMVVAQSAPEPPARERPANRPADPTPLAEAKRSLSPAKVRDLWSKTDTRSLDRALTSLRSKTLAFQRCEMRVTSDDRAVAHCDEAGPDSTAKRVAWTIDFRRNDGHWLIDDLSSTGPAPLNP